MTENQEFITQSIINQVRSGFFSINEIKENIIEEIEDNEFENELSEKWAFKQIKVEYSKLVEESKNWKNPTDTEKLIKAFDTLCLSDIIAIHNAGYTMSDGEYEVVEIERELRNEGVESNGYCFYHQQDLERAIQSDECLYIAFQKVDNNDEETAIEVGKKVIEVLHNYGFETEWNETVDKRILIKNFKWQWLYDSNNRDFLDYGKIVDMMIYKK